MVKLMKVHKDPYSRAGVHVLIAIIACSVLTWDIILFGVAERGAGGDGPSHLLKPLLDLTIALLKEAK